VRLRGAFVDQNGEPLVLGGKTGTGDNRRGTFNAAGDRVGWETLNRTATFVFYVGDRYYGVLTASVDGPESDQYTFTSSLPLGVLQLLAPDIARRAAVLAADDPEAETEAWRATTSATRTSR
jgi:hypothetical protein